MHRSVQTLDGHAELVVIGPSGGGRHAPPGIEYRACPPSAAAFLPCALVRGLVACMRYDFDFVLGGSGLVAPLTAVLGKLFGLRRTVFVHGLDIVADSRIYQRLFVPTIAMHETVVANSRNTKSLAEAAGCSPETVKVVHPGTSIPESLPTDRSVLTNRGLEDSATLLFVGRIIPRKGLAEFIGRAWPQIRSRRENAALLVVGDSPDDALNRDPRGAPRLEEALRQIPSGSVHFLGNVPDEELRSLYAAATCLIFPLVEVRGDVEGFGMVAIEAAACGTPTIAFAVGGVVDAVNEPLSGRLIEPGDYEAFADACIDAIDGDRPSAGHCREFARNFDWERHGRQLSALILGPDREHG